MRSSIFEGNTWAIYEELREKDKTLHKNLCKLLKEMLRGDPSAGNTVRLVAQVILSAP